MPKCITCDHCGIIKEQKQITGPFADHILGCVNGNRGKYNKVSLQEMTAGEIRINAHLFEALDACLNALRVNTGTTGTF